MLAALKDFEIDQKLGYITANNYGANNTLCKAISNKLVNWQLLEHRLQYIGYIINLAV